MQSQFPIFDREFFDWSSEVWRSNKVVRPNGYFMYRCKYISTKKGSRCKKPCYNRSDLCKQHTKLPSILHRNNLYLINKK